MFTVAVASLLVVVFLAGHASAVTIGEAGVRKSMDNDEWNFVSLSGSYGSTPHVFATTITANGGSDPSAAHVRSVSTSGFETQHCEWDLPDTCDGHKTERNGWIALDPGDVNSVAGMETGTLTVDGTSGQRGDEFSVSFSSTFSTAPLVFVQVQTQANNPDNMPLNVQVVDRSTTGFTVEFCEQETDDACDGHRDETVAWWAIDPSEVAETASFQYGTVSVTDSNWASVSWPTFDNRGPVIAMVQTDNGAQEALYPEVKDVWKGGADVRFCEGYNPDTSTPENDCDDHQFETVAWLAVERGPIDVDGGGGGGDNNPPTADFTYSCTNLDCSFTDQSSDSDGSIASWSWDFGDGASSTQQHPTHTYSCDGTYTVTLTVTDDDGATDSTSKDVSVTDADSDGDGLHDCVEEQGGMNSCFQSWNPTEPTEPDTDSDGLDDGAEVNTHCTAPNDPDTDDDEFLDGEEVDNFQSTLSKSPSEVLCGSGGSPCAYPDPLQPDIYLEVDGWRDCGLVECDTHSMSDETRKAIKGVFSDQSVRAHIDNGRFDNGAIKGGGQIIDDGERTESFDELENNYASSNQYFDDDRREIWHYMIYVHELTQAEGDALRTCGIGNSPGFFSAIAHEEHFTIQPPDCYDSAVPSDSLVITTLQELGHNDLFEIEPTEDKCNDDSLHDDKTDYIMAVEACGEHVNVDFHGNRWTEYMEHVGPDDVGCDDSLGQVDAECNTDLESRGDLNRGVRGL